MELTNPQSQLIPVTIELNCVNHNKCNSHKISPMHCMLHLHTNIAVCSNVFQLQISTITGYTAYYSVFETRFNLLFCRISTVYTWSWLSL